jgi:uncharacterized protein
VTADDEATARIATLDILRGVAVMGILAMNIVGFAMPMQAYFNPRAYGGAEGADLAAWAVNFVLFDGKMRGLFSFLFGASMLLVIDRAEKKGGSPAEIHFRRMIWLLLFGLAHYYLVWLGDILAHYAIVGMIAFLYHRMPVDRLVRWGVIFLAAQLLLMGAGAYGFFAAEHAALAPGATAEAVRQWRSMSLDFRTLSPSELAASLAIYRGGYDDVIRYQLTSGVLGPAVQLVGNGFETLGLMLLGMASLRSGFLTGDWDVARYRRVALAFLGMTIPAYALLAWSIYRSGFSPAMILAGSFGLGTVLRPAMVIGYAALIILLARRGGALVRRLAAAGRAAFTNYLGTSLIVTGFFYGLGQFGRLDRAELWLVVLPVWALMLLWSKPWLERYRYGPFEWLWRSLARGEPQPMRKAPAD